MDKFINKVTCGDCRDVLKQMNADSVDSVVCDAPYELGFMSKSWDSTGIAYNVDMWKEVLRVLKPGGYLLSFGGSRTYHRMACAIEDAGFITHPMIGWVYATGFPKASNLSKQIDKSKGIEREDKFEGLGRNIGPSGNKKCDKCGKWLVSGTPCQCPRPQDAAQSEEGKQWEGWYYGLQSLKPALEPICMAQKPISEKNMVANILKHSTGAINIDACRIKVDKERDKSQLRTMNRSKKDADDGWGMNDNQGDTPEVISPKGRFPANFILECCCEEVIRGKAGEVVKTNRQKGMGKVWNKDNSGLRNNPSDFGGFKGEVGDIHTDPNCPCYQLDQQSGVRKSGYMSPELHKRNTTKGNYQSPHGIYGEYNNTFLNETYGDTGGASRYFYCAKASKSERDKGLEGMENKIQKIVNNRRCKICGHQQVSGSPYTCPQPDWEIISQERTGKNNHPTVKPLALMKYLIKLATPPNGIVLDPFAGSGSTLVAAKELGYRFIGIEKEQEYVTICLNRLSNSKTQQMELV